MLVDLTVENIANFSFKVEIVDLKREFESNPFIKCFGYVNDKDIVGYLLYEDIYDRFDIVNLFVNEQYRNNNIASKLLTELIKSGKDQNIINITLEVNSKNVIAIHLYKKFGFVERAIRSGYYSGTDGILMEKEMM